MSTITFPISYFPDPDKGRPLFNGQVYIGKSDLDPTVPANQKPVFYIQEDGTLVAASQPVLLSAGGVPTYNGSPVTLDVDGAYSIKVLDKYGAQMYYVANTENTGAGSSKIAEQTLLLTAGQTTVVFSKVLVDSASVYIGSAGVDRGRLIKGVDYNVTGSLTIELTSSFPAGSYCSAIAREAVADNQVDYVRRYLDLAGPINDTTLLLNDTVNITARTAGDGGSAVWDVVSATTVTTNTYTIMQCIGDTDLALVLRLDIAVTPAMLGLSITTPRNEIVSAINFLTADGGTFIAPFGFIVDTAQLTNPELVNTFAGASEVKSNRAVSTPAGRLNRPIELIAHRGASDIMTENTLIAWSQTLSLGFDSWEGDVQITSDGVPVMFHDETVDALTDGTGAISSMTLVQVEALRFTALQSAQFLDVKIPTLAEAIKLASEAGVKMYLEIKEYRTPADISLMNAIVDAANMSESVQWDSFIMQDLIAMRALNRVVELGLLRSVVPTQEDEDSLALLGNAYMFVSQSLVLANNSLVKKWKQLGFGVAIFTPVSADFIIALQRIGVDAIVTDNILWGLN